jgi:hypothetical protein
LSDEAILHAVCGARRTKRFCRSLSDGRGVAINVSLGQHDADTSIALALELGQATTGVGTAVMMVVAAAAVLPRVMDGVILSAAQRRTVTCSWQLAGRRYSFGGNNLDSPANRQPILLPMPRVRSLVSRVHFLPPKLTATCKTTRDSRSIVSIVDFELLHSTAMLFLSKQGQVLRTKGLFTIVRSISNSTARHRCKGTAKP